MSVHRKNSRILILIVSHSSTDYFRTLSDASVFPRCVSFVESHRPLLLPARHNTVLHFATLLDFGLITQDQLLHLVTLLDTGRS